MLDPGSLTALGHHFDRLMLAIQGRVDAVSRVGLFCSSTTLYLTPAMSWRIEALSLSSPRDLDSRGYVCFIPNMMLRL